MLRVGRLHRTRYGKRTKTRFCTRVMHKQTTISGGPSVLTGTMRSSGHDTKIRVDRMRVRCIYLRKVVHHGLNNKKYRQATKHLVTSSAFPSV